MTDTNQVPRSHPRATHHTEVIGIVFFSREALPVSAAQLSAPCKKGSCREMNQRFSTAALSLISHLLCSEPSHGSHYIWPKAKVLNPRPYHLSDLISFPSTLWSLLSVPENAKHIPAPGPLHLPFFSAERLFLPLFTYLFLIFSKCQKMSLFRDLLDDCR